jgi:hypothetical protein
VHYRRHRIRKKIRRTARQVREVVLVSSKAVLDPIRKVLIRVIHPMSKSAHQMYKKKAHLWILNDLMIPTQILIPVKISQSRNKKNKRSIRA